MLLVHDAVHIWPERIVSFLRINMEERTRVEPSPEDRRRWRLKHDVCVNAWSLSTRSL